MFTDERVATVDDLRSFSLELGPHQGMSLLIVPPVPAPQDEAAAPE
jgi:hypothetical protein